MPGHGINHDQIVWRAVAGLIEKSTLLDSAAGFNPVKLVPSTSYRSAGPAYPIGISYRNSRQNSTIQNGSVHLGKDNRLANLIRFGESLIRAPSNPKDVRSAECFGAIFEVNSTS